MPRIVTALLLAASPALAGLPAESVQRLKDATVLVHSTLRLQQGTGSGFVCAVRGQTVYVVTNAHVTVFGREAAERIRLVFCSGQAGERTVTVEAVARDPEHDLAVLRASLPNAPMPLALDAAPTPRETQEVYVVGFPFGRSLSVRAGNPEVTLSKGAVSSIRRDMDNQVAGVQIAGDVNPGNSGGPVVNDKGMLVGVCVAKIRGTSIGFAIPAAALKRLLVGRVGEVSVVEGARANELAEVTVTASLLDPLSQIRSVVLLTGPAASATTQPLAGADGAWRAISPKMRATVMSCSANLAKASVRLAAARDRRVGYWRQLRIVRTDGTTVYTAPEKLFLTPTDLGVTKAGGTNPDDDDWLGDTPTRPRPRTKPRVAPKASPQTLAGETIALDGAAAVPIKLPADDIAPDIQWAPDGRSLFVLSGCGIVRKITWPGLIEERLVDLREPCNRLGLSKLGPVVSAGGAGELWVLSPATLRVVRRIAVRGAAIAVTAPGSSQAVALMPGPALSIFDLGSGRLVRTVRPDDFHRPPAPRPRQHRTSSLASTVFEPKLAAMSPDGRYLFCLSRACLHRFEISASGLAYQEAGPAIAGDGPARIEVSSDSRYVAVLSAGGNAEPSDHPPIGRHGTYIYSVGDLQTPVMNLRQGAYPAALAFDKARRRLYSQNLDHHLVSFQVNGQVDKSYRILNSRERTLQIAVPPAGKCALVLTDSGLYSVTFAK